MASLDYYLDEQLSRGRAYFSREEALEALGLSAEAFIAAAARLAKKHRLVSPRRGFYLILRPEDRVAGAPDPVRWIDPLMKYLSLDYRISLLRAAAFHGASHQAAMVFQVIVPKQLRAFDIGRHRLQFIYQTPAAFAKTNVPDWLSQMKSEAGFARVAGVELTLLDCARYFTRPPASMARPRLLRTLVQRPTQANWLKPPWPMRTPPCAGLGICWSALVTWARPRSWNRSPARPNP